MNKKRVSVSLPSQRIDRYSQKLAQLVKGVRSTTITLAPEAGSQRLRNVINKNLSIIPVRNQLSNTIIIPEVGIDPLFMYADIVQK